MISFPEPDTARLALVEAGRSLRAAGFVVAREGNLSLRLDGDRLLITPAGLDKGALTVADLAEVAVDGRHLDGPPPSTELRMHLAIYAIRPDVGAVVHAHPPHATAFAVSGRPLHADVLPEAAVLLGAVPVAAYATPGTEKVGVEAARVASSARAFLLSHHGAVALGPDLATAMDRLETLERLAQVCWLAEALGGARRLDPVERERLRVMGES